MTAEASIAAEVGGAAAEEEIEGNASKKEQREETVKDELKCRGNRISEDCLSFSSRVFPAGVEKFTR